MTPEQLHVVLAEAALSTLRPAEDPAPAGTVLRRGGDVAAGDWQSNLPLRLGTREPLSAADSIAEAVASHPDIASVTVTGPGFLRIVLETPALLDTVAAIAAGRHLGDPGSGATLASSDRLMEPDGLGVLDADALRYGSARSRTATVLARDVELLRTAAPANPLHCVQHAHATGRRLLRRAAAAGIRVAAGLAADEAEHRTPDVTLAPADRQLALRITEAAGVLARATGTAATGTAPTASAATGRQAGTRSQSDSPQPTGRYDVAGRHSDIGRRPGESLRSVTAVLEDLAAALTAWSAAERAIVPTLDADITAVHAARCVLAAGATTVLATGLRLLGVTAPERI